MIATEADLNQRYATHSARKTEYRALQAVLKEARASGLTAIKLAGKGITKQVLKTEFQAIALKLSHRQPTTELTYETFKHKAIATYNRLQQFDLMPIWKMRDAFGEVDPADFNDWLMRMQAENLFYLQSGEARAATDEQKRKGIYSEFRGLLFFISRPEWLEQRRPPTSAPTAMPMNQQKSRQVAQLPINRGVENIVCQLLKDSDGYATIPEFRRRTDFLGLNIKEQNSHLYRLEAEGKIDLSTLQQTRFYRGQIDLGIPQPLIGEIPGPPLFFILAAS